VRARRCVLIFFIGGGCCLRHGFGHRHRLGYHAAAGGARQSARKTGAVAGDGNPHALHESTRDFHIAANLA